MGLESGRTNRASQHPPLYYAITSGLGNGLVALLPFGGTLAVEDQLWIYRAVSLLWVIPLPLIAALIARHLGGRRSEQVLASVMVLVSPSFFLRTGSMINNDAPTILLSSVIFLLAVIIVRSGWGRWRATILGSLVGVALLMKGLALPLVAFVLVTVVGRVVRLRAVHAKNVLSGIWAGTVAMVIGGWWWLRNIIRYERIQPLVFEPTDPVEQELSAVPTWATEWFANTFRSFWGSWYIPSYGPLFWFLVILVATTIVLALRQSTLRVEVFLALALGALLVSGVMLVSLNRFLGSGLIKGDQGRYLFPALAALGAISALAWSRGKPRVLTQPHVLMGVLALTLWMHLHSWRRFARTQWGQPGDTLGERWEALIAWAPVREEVVYAFVLGALLSFVLVLVTSLRSDMQGEDERPSVAE